MVVLEAIRDVIIILVALAALIANVALILLVLRLWGLVKELRQEVSPILGSLTQTSDTVRGTTTLIGDLVVRPLARLAGYLAWLNTLVGALGTLGRGSRR